MHNCILTVALAAHCYKGVHCFQKVNQACLVWDLVWGHHLILLCYEVHDKKQVNGAEGSQQTHLFLSRRLCQALVAVSRVILYIKNRACRPGMLAARTDLGHVLGCAASQLPAYVWHWLTLATPRSYVQVWRSRCPRSVSEVLPLSMWPLAHVVAHGWQVARVFCIFVSVPSFGCWSKLAWFDSPQTDSGLILYWPLLTVSLHDKIEFTNLVGKINWKP